jgi:adenylate cyclase
MASEDGKAFPWKQYTGIIIAVVTVLIVEFVYNTPLIQETLQLSFFQAIERRSLDMLMRIRGVRENSNSVIMIKIDDYTDKQLGWPIPRDQYGAVMTLLSNSGAKAVALDVILPKKQDDDSTENAMMVQYLSMAKNIYQVIGPFIPSGTDREYVSRKDVDSTAHYMIGKHGIPTPRNHHFPRSPFINDYPFQELSEVSTGVGHAMLIPDTLDGVIRTMPLYIEYCGQLYPSIGLAVALKALNIEPSKVKFEDTEDGTIVHAGPLTIHTGTWGEVFINYIGKSSNIPSVSFYDILAAAKQRNEKFFDQFKGKVCIIGPTIRSVGDYYANPVEESAAGFLTHANVYDMVITNSFIETAPGWIQFLILLLMTLAVGYLAQKQHMRIGVISWLLIIILYMTFAIIAFTSEHLLFNIAAPLSALLICFISTVAYRAATEGRQRKKITEMFGTYVDNNVVQILINNPQLAKLGGEKHEISILFTDIKGFSTISEKISEDALVKLMNMYFTEMTNVILANGGSVDKFIGDSIMAFWGAPLEDPNSSFHACKTALLMRAQLERIQPRLSKIAGQEVKHRIGVNTGICIVGNMGSEQKKNYTVTGDPVNLASRLEGVNKQYGTGILISEFTQKKVANKFYVREVDRVQVVGKSEPVKIYELRDLADKPLSDDMKYFLDIYNEGVKAYQERRWDEGIAYMEHAMTKVPNDTVCELYIERMRLYKLTPPASDWNGVFVLHSK